MGNSNAEAKVTLLELAQMSYAVYFPDKLFDGSVAPPGWKPYGNGSGDAEDNRLGYRGQAFVNERTKEVVIAHRGTEI